MKRSKIYGRCKEEREGRKEREGRTERDKVHGVL